MVGTFLDLAVISRLYVQSNEHIMSIVSKSHSTCKLFNITFTFATLYESRLYISFQLASIVWYQSAMGLIGNIEKPKKGLRTLYFKENAFLITNLYSLP